MLHYEDFTVGEAVRYGPYRLSAEEVIAFARNYDPQWFHLDAEAAREGPFGGLAASGWQTCGIVMRLMVDGYISGSDWLGSPGVDEIRWLRPAMADSDIYAVRRTLSKRVSQSKPDRGLVTFAWEAVDAADQLLMTLRVTGIVRLK